MEKLKKRREIIDRAALQAELDAVIDTARQTRQSDQDRRQAMLACYRQALASGFDEVRRRFGQDQDGALAVRGNAFVVDQLIRAMYETAAIKLYPASSQTEAEKLCIVAVGGYGRGELAPRSDIDLLFLLPYKRTARHEVLVEEILYLLWDLGLTVGHATRTVRDCMNRAKADMVIRTGLLEARHLIGDRMLFNELRTRLFKEIAHGTGPDFVESKLRERDERHERMGDSRYVLEPNIKDGKGGLRDLHTLYWLAKYLYEVDSIAGLVEVGVLTRREVARFVKAQVFLWTLRCHLHDLTGRAEERMTFDVQPELARRMGYTDRARTSGVERFMKHYFLIAKDVGDLTRIFCAAIEARHQRRKLFRLPRLGMFHREIEGFKAVGDRLTVASEVVFADDPVKMLQIFEVSLRNDLDIHPDALQWITRNLPKITRSVQQDPDANRVFMDILTAENNPEGTLRHINECGLFGRFLPDFGRVVAQMQYDMYHVYTTDEHTIRALGILHRVEKGELKADHPVASEIIGKVLSRQVLYVAVLLHDIAKGRGGDHSIIGAEIAKRVCPRLGLTEAETETVSWLVLEHLAMSRTAFKRDLGDPKTIADFVTLVQSPERLRLLLCLTVADVRAVGPKIWNNWKATLLRELHYKSEDVMSGGLITEGHQARVEAAKHDLAAALSGWSPEEVQAFLALGRPSYFLSNDLETLCRHAELVRAAHAMGQDLALATKVDADRAATEVTVFAADHPGLFSRLAGALALAGASIVDAKIGTMTDGSVLDSFWVQDRDGGVFARPDKLAKLSALVKQVLSGRIRIRDELEKRQDMPSRTRVFTVAPRVLIDDKASNTHTVIEVNGRDRPALLFEITRALTDLGLQISNAKISTYGEQVVDVFYVKDAFGMKIDHPEKLNQIKERLDKVLTPSWCRPSDKHKAAATSGKGAADTGTSARLPKKKRRGRRRDTPAAAE